MDVLQALLHGVAIFLEGFRFDPVDRHLDAVGHATVVQGFDQRLVGVLQHGVFADDRDGHLTVRLGIAVGDVRPQGQVGLGRVFDAEDRQHFGVHALAVIVDRHGVDVFRIQRLDDGRFADIAEQADLAAFLARDLLLAAAQQDVGLDTDRSQFLDAVLGRLGLHLAGRLDEGQEGQVDKAGVAARQFLAQLANGFEKRQAFDVADRAADLDQDEVRVALVGQDEGFDLVGDVGNDLDGSAQIVATPLLFDDVRIDAAGRDIVGLACADAGETFVVTQVEIGFGAVVGDEDFAVLVRAHRARIDIEIGVELAQADLEAAGLEQGAQRRRSQALAEGRHHTAGDENETRHIDLT